VLAAGFQLGLQLVGGVKVVFNGTLIAARYKYHVAYAGGIGFFHRVLDQRPVHDGQHLFGLGLGGGQKARSQTGDREDGLGNFCDFFHRRSYLFWIECGRNETNSK
jgi:hypothetical protein